MNTSGTKLQFESIYAARDYVATSGVLDWSWGYCPSEDGQEDDDFVVNWMLPAFLRDTSGRFEDFQQALRDFIVRGLGQDPADYNL